MPSAKSATKTEKATKSAKASDSKSKSPKHGGNIVQDLQKLAVPFAILVAKKGLDAAVEKTNQKTATKTNASKSSKTGGSNTLNKRKSVRGDMDKLSNEIEKYLSKY
jgi:hypothetical protein